MNNYFDETKRIDCGVSGRFGLALIERKARLRQTVRCIHPIRRRSYRWQRPRRNVWAIKVSSRRLGLWPGSRLRIVEAPVDDLRRPADKMTFHAVFQRTAVDLEGGGDRVHRSVDVLVGVRIADNE